MRTSQLSLAAFAFLAAASPVAKSELGNTNAFTILSADSALSKRVISGILSAGTVSINGQVGPPGSQPFPGVFVENLPQTPICDITCLDAQVRPPDSTCIKKGCTKASFSFFLSYPSTLPFVFYFSFRVRKPPSTPKNDFSALDHLANSWSTS